MIKKWIQIAFAGAFLMVIGLPFAKSFFNTSSQSDSENRELAPVPKINLKQLDKLPNEFNAYWADHFGWRNQFIDASHYIKMDVLGVSPMPDKVIFGTKGWFYMKGKPYKCFSGLNKFTPKQIKIGRAELTKRANFAKEKGIPYVIFIAPNKHRIYRENLPFHIRQLTDSIQVEQLVALAKTIDGIEVIDLADWLIDSKSKYEYPVYQKTDNHWNAVGGYAAYTKMVYSLQKYFAQIPDPYPYSAYNVIEKTNKGGALARYLRRETELTETQYPMRIQVDYDLEIDTNERHTPPEKFVYPDEYEIRTINYRDSTLPKILWFRDSFGRLVAPHLKHNVGNLVEIFDSWKYRLNPEIIVDEKPDAVVLLILERNIKCIMTGGNCAGNF
ncbi:MAG: alginate O-acetyltransferase AlgX-related protein [Bacteroidia bacterium]